ncbi:hypothetical protein D3C79_996610 [compost metagenome]
MKACLQSVYNDVIFTYHKKEGYPMSVKRKPPTIQKKKEEVNRKAIMWTAVSFVGLVLLIVIVILLANRAVQ